MTSKTIVDTSTGELSTLTIPENDVTRYLAGIGINPGAIAWEAAPAVYLNEVEGAMIAGRFSYVELAEVSEYGPSPVITFKGEAGHAVHSTSGPVDIVNGEEYAMHLFHGVLHDQFVDLALQPGELFVIRFCGMRPMRNGEDGDEYGMYVVAAPERPIVKAALDWATLGHKTKTPGASSKGKRK